MILNEIALRNYGVYRGSHRALLTPSHGKPIVLFGGLNGGGKTTLLDAFQLALYGSKARLSNRGRLGYKDYLKQCINRDVRTGDWAEVQLDFTKVLNGASTQFVVTRSWRDGPKGIVEELSVSLNGTPDSLFTEHWDEIVDTYLPSSISHLFFFDGEQIAALAEQSSAAGILGTAVYSLLGLDLVDRLQADLKAFERRKQTTALDSAAVSQLKALGEERDSNDRLEESLVTQRGELTNELHRLRKTLADHEAEFRARGGVAYEKQQELQSQLKVLIAEKQVYEEQLRQLAAGALPLAMVASQLEHAAQQAGAEIAAKRTVVLMGQLVQRDEGLVQKLCELKVPKASVDCVAEYLFDDRSERQRAATCDIVLSADEAAAASLRTLHDVTVPSCVQQSKALLAKLNDVEERLARVEAELGRVPEQDSVADVRARLRACRAEIDAKVAECDALTVRQEAARRRTRELDDAIQRVAEQGLNAQQAEDARVRTLKHSKKVRDTLDAFRLGVVKRHITSIESLVLDAFRSLLRKKNLIHSLTINPDTFDVVLWQQPGMPLSFDRLSAGERQLLATALLWGLARAAGRPIPTIIDTPLGRLDSSHRGRLVESYFPHASHQVILLSTDQEISGSYHTALKPYVGREYTLAHDDTIGATSILQGYFASHETTV
jgi:DNA sulfur modification protein DndD